MNDLLKDTTKPKNIEELYKQILKIVIELYEQHVPQSVKARKS